MERIFTGDIPVVGSRVPGLEPEGGADPLLQPLYLLADSQLLFWADERGSFVERIAERLPVRSPRAAYVGASNGDDPEYYTIFLAAMEGMSPADCRMIRSRPTPGDEAFLETADVILLAGGDVLRGWTVMEASGMRERIQRRYQAGAALIGVSAGAVQLGAVGWSGSGRDVGELFPTFGLAPFVVSAHDEQQGWESLRAAVLARGEETQGIGIPTGGGAVYHPDGTLEPVRHPLCEIVVSEGGVVSNVLLPPTEAA
jgi:cyanophycinase